MTSKCHVRGIHSFHSFLKRNPDITLRKPENCSLTRATSFNAHNVKIFYDNLQKVYDREPRFSDPSNVFNLDETATTTVPTKTPSVIAAKNTKQVSQATSGEKGVLVTTFCIINAAGGFLPPAMVFPRVEIFSERNTFISFLSFIRFFLTENSLFNIII